MRNALASVVLASAVLATSLICAASANAATFHFRTLSTAGTYSSAATPTTSDTTAAFSVDLSFTSLNDVSFSNGVFTDAHIDSFNFPQRAIDFSATAVDLTSFQVNLSNPDGAILDLVISTILPSITGSYDFGGPGGESARGTFIGTLSPVPLPAAAPMFGAALLGLAGLGYTLKRKGKAVA